MGTCKHLIKNQIFAYFKQPRQGRETSTINHKLFIFVILLGRVAAHYKALESDSEGFIPIESESSDTGK